MRRHAFDPVSLVFGAIFAGVGLTFLFGTIDLAALPPAWSWPIPLMIVGALIILLAVRRDRAYAPSRSEQRFAATDPIVAAEPFSATEPYPATEPNRATQALGPGAVAAGGASQWEAEPDATTDAGTVNPPDGS
jgi:hypothetical protein